MLSQSRLKAARSPAWRGALVDFLHYMLFFGWQRTTTLRRRRSEILLTSIEWDGTRQGFDLRLIHNV